MCSLSLKCHSVHPPNRFNRGAERAFQAVLNGYDRGLKFVFRHQVATLMLTLILMAATALLYTKIPKGFFPQQDTGSIFGQPEARPDTPHRNGAGLPHK